MEDIFEIFGQGLIAAFGTAAVFAIAIAFTLHGPFAEFLAAGLAAIFG